MTKTLVLGNIITVDEKKPFAKAAVVKDGLFAYVGNAEEAKRLAGEDAQVLDYGENFIYPGFIESHSHGHLAGDRFIGQANLMQAGFTNYPKYREIIKEFTWPPDGWRTMSMSPRPIWTRYALTNRCSCTPAAVTPCCSIRRHWNGPA